MFPYIGEKAVRRFEEMSSNKVLQDNKLYFNHALRTYFKVSSHGFLFTYKKDIDESGKVSIKEYKLDKEGDYILSKVIPITERELEVNINNAEVI